MSAKNFFSNAFDALTFVRQFTLNALFVLGLLSFALIAIVLMGGREPLVVKEQSTLVLDLHGAIVEQYTADELDRALALLAGSEMDHEMRLYDVLQTIERAKDDPKITQIYLRVDGLSKIGFAQMREISDALLDFKKSGKKIVAFGQMYSQKQYFLAATADHVFMDPEGAVILEGLSSFRQYYKGALDRVGVDMHLFKVGEYKSAAEPFILNSASSESKQADLYWMSDVWDRYLNDLASFRKLDRARIDQQIKNFPDELRAVDGDLASLAIDQGFVDALKTEEDVEEFLVNSSTFDEEQKTYRHIDMDDYLVASQQGAENFDQKIAIVVAQGEIVDGESAPGVVGGASLSDQMRQVREDPSVRAVVLRVDSPGGSVYASEQIRREVELLKSSGRPVVVSMGNSAASGGYWISMNADQIIADPSTITGSIGIFGLVPNISKALSNVGVNTDGVATTELARAGDITQPITPYFSAIIQSVIDNGYKKFISNISLARNMSIDQVNEHARGRVWTGQQALDRGLVDELGGLRSALSSARSLAQLDQNTPVVIVDPKATPMSSWLMAGQGSVLDRVGDQLGVWSILQSKVTPKSMQSDLALLDRAITSQKPVYALAHCFCNQVND